VGTWRSVPDAFPSDVTHALEALKLQLAGMHGGDLDATQAEAMRVEISAIRLQLQRMALEQKQLAAELERRALES
jgi:hypothetical protein